MVCHFCTAQDPEAHGGRVTCVRPHTAGTDCTSDDGFFFPPSNVIYDFITCYHVATVHIISDPLLCAFLKGRVNTLCFVTLVSHSTGIQLNRAAINVFLKGWW